LLLKEHISKSIKESPLHVEENVPETRNLSARESPTNIARRSKFHTTLEFAKSTGLESVEIMHPACANFHPTNFVFPAATAHTTRNVFTHGSKFSREGANQVASPDIPRFAEPGPLPTANPRPSRNAEDTPRLLEEDPINPKHSPSSDTISSSHLELFVTTLNTLALRPSKEVVTPVT
jgi:hypothetical protein